MVPASPFFSRDRDRLATLALNHRLPSAFAAREWVDSGGLMSYGASLTGMARLTAEYVGKILKGAKPAELPVQQPTTLELVINLETANSLGLTIPQSIIFRADEVIE
jgi:putative ABC transport system substrate-binding protein